MLTGRPLFSGSEVVQPIGAADTRGETVGLDGSELFDVGFDGSVAGNTVTVT